MPQHQENPEKDPLFQAAIRKFDEAYEFLAAATGVTRAPFPNVSLEPELKVPSEESLKPELTASSLFGLSLLGANEEVAIKSEILTSSLTVKELVVALEKKKSLTQATEIIELTTRVMEGLRQQEDDYLPTITRLNEIAEELIQNSNLEHRTLGRALRFFLLVVAGVFIIIGGLLTAVASSTTAEGIIFFGKACFFDGLNYLRNKESQSNQEKITLQQEIVQLTRKATLANEKKIIFRSAIVPSFFPPSSLSVAIPTEEEDPPPYSPIREKSPVSPPTESKTSPFLVITDQDVEIYFSPDFFIAYCALLLGGAVDENILFYHIMQVRNGLLYDAEKINLSLNHPETLGTLDKVRLSGLEGSCNTLGTGYKLLAPFSSAVSEELRNIMMNGNRLNHYVEIIRANIPDTTFEEARALLAASSVIGDAKAQGSVINSGAFFLAEYLKPCNFVANLSPETRVSKKEDGSFIIESIVRPTEGMPTISPQSGEKILNPIQYHETYHLKQNEEKGWVLTLQPKNYLYVNREVWKHMLTVAEDAFNKRTVSSRDLFTIIPCLIDEKFAKRFETAFEMRPEIKSMREDIKLLLTACYGKQLPAHLEQLNSLLDASVEETPAPRSSRSGSLSRGAAS